MGANVRIQNVHDHDRLELEPGLEPGRGLQSKTPYSAKLITLICHLSTTEPRASQ